MRTQLLFLFVLSFFCADAQVSGELPPMMMETSARDRTATTADGESFTIGIEDRQTGTIIGYQVKNYDKGYGLIDYTTKKKLTPFVFDKITGFYDTDFSMVELGRKQGVIDNKGNIVVPCVYDMLMPFELAGVQYYIASKNARMGVVNNRNEIVLPFDYENITREIRDERDKVQLVLEKNGKMGLMDFTTRKIIIPVQYDRVRPDPDNHVLIQHNTLYSYFNVSTGKMLTGWYRRIDVIDDNAVMVEQNGKWGVIDWTGKQIIPLEYEKMDRILGYNLFVASRAGKYGLIARDGKVVLPMQYDLVENMDLSTKLVKVSNNSKKGLFSLEGKVVLPVEYDVITAVDSNFIVKKNNKSGVINRTGNFILPAEYDGLTNVRVSSSVNWLLTYKDNKKGMVNINTGKANINCIYDDLIGRYKSNTGITQIFEFSFIAIKNGKYGFLNLMDEKVRVPFEYDEILYMDNRYLIAKKGGKYGVIDFNNTVMIPFEYQFISYKNSAVVAYKGEYEKFVIKVDKIEKVSK